MNWYEKIFGVRCIDCESYYKKIRNADNELIRNFCSCGGPDLSKMIQSIPNPKDLRRCIFYDKKKQPTTKKEGLI